MLASLLLSIPLSILLSVLLFLKLNKLHRTFVFNAEYILEQDFRMDR